MQLELEWREVPWGSFGPFKYLDFVVDGESLGNDRYRAWGVSVLGNGVSDWEETQARRLLLDEPPEADDRVSLYVDPLEGAMDGGAVTVLIAHQGNEIVWRDAAWSQDDSNSELASGLWHNCGAYQQWPDLRFKADEYRHLIEGRPRPS